MTKRSFPDVNVWFALAVADHPHHPPALAWWNEESSLAGFSRLTQLGLLRLLTTAAAMGGQPLTNEEAWRVYAGFLSDSRVRLFPELAALEDLFRALFPASAMLPPRSGLTRIWRRMLRRTKPSWSPSTKPSRATLSNVVS